MADFETTTDPDDCRVWVWGITRLDNPSIIDWGTELTDFIDLIQTHNSIIYFHNLRFDGHFIVDWLLRNGYEHRSDQGRGTSPMQFRTVISYSNKWYSITVKWENGHSTEFRDSHKKLHMPVRHIAPAFNLEMSKGDIDYHKPRPIGYEPDEEELDYLARDIVIVAIAMRQLLDEGMTRLTVAADSLAEYKRLVTDKWFSRTFPVLSDSMDAEIRRAYRGGFTYVDKRFLRRRVGKGLVLDVNSLYPYVMSSKVLPYGEPVFVEGKPEIDEKYPLSIFSVTFTAKLKPNSVPCIQIKGSSIFGGTEYLEEINEPTTLMVTNVDWELYNMLYDIDVVAWGGGWLFKGAVGLFDRYIDKWSAIKQESVGGKREIAKLHLNSLYGKFASNPDVTGKIPVLEDDKVRLIVGPEEKKAPIYTAVGVFVTSYGRDLTIRAAQASYDVFAYADTDSLHLLTDEIPEALDVHPTRMGAWKLEYYFDDAYYVRPKVYLERLATCPPSCAQPHEHVTDVTPCSPDCDTEHKHTREYHVAWAGLSAEEQEKRTFDDLVPGKVFPNAKLEPKSVRGGVVLVDRPYTLKI